MKNYLLSAVLFLFGTTLFGQTITPESVSPEEYATLQTNEFADFFDLTQEKRDKLYQINYTCWSKIKDTYDTDMPDEVKLENKIYNIKLRQQSVYKVLSVDQMDVVSEFLENSTYNKIIQF